MSTHTHATRIAIESVAQKAAAPGTPELGAALRDALKGIKDLAGARGIYLYLDRGATQVCPLRMSD